MPKVKSAARGAAAGKGDALAARCASIPGKMFSNGVAFARRELEEILTAKAHKGVLPGSGKRGNVFANLWFVRAAHEFADAAAKDPHAAEYLAYATDKLLPACKAIVQEFISDKGMNGVRMDDSGMLAQVGSKAKGASALRLNALWYAALEVTGQALRGLTPMGKGHPGHTGMGRHTGDHFERLAGRFRRAFSKAFWCDQHDRICNPELRDQPDHGTVPDGEQLLLTMLPASPLPRTKQREILSQIDARAGESMGVKVVDPQHGLVDSPLFRAWLAQGYAVDGDMRKVAAVARPLVALRESAQISSVFALYHEGHPIGRQPDPLVGAEVLGTLHRFLNHDGPH